MIGIELKLLLIFLELVQLKQILIHIENHQILIRHLDPVLVFQNIQILQLTIQYVELGLQVAYLLIILNLLTIKQKILLGKHRISSRICDQFRLASMNLRDVLLALVVLAGLLVFLQLFSEAQFLGFAIIQSLYLIKSLNHLRVFLNLALALGHINIAPEHEAATAAAPRIPPIRLDSLAVAAVPVPPVADVLVAGDVRESQ